MTATEVPQHPFSTVLSLKVIELVHARDLDMQKLRNDYRDAKLTKEDFVKALEAVEANLADHVLATCERTLRTLEDTVNKVLQLQEQMRVLRDAAAGNIPGKI